MYIYTYHPYNQVVIILQAGIVYVHVLIYSEIKLRISLDEMNHYQPYIFN